MSEVLLLKYFSTLVGTPILKEIIIKVKIEIGGDLRQVFYKSLNTTPPPNNSYILADENKQLLL